MSLSLVEGATETEVERESEPVVAEVEGATEAEEEELRVVLVADLQGAITVQGELSSLISVNMVQRVHSLWVLCVTMMAIIFTVH